MHMMTMKWTRVYDYDYKPLAVWLPTTLLLCFFYAHTIYLIFIQYDLIWSHWQVNNTIWWIGISKLFHDTISVIY